MSLFKRKIIIVLFILIVLSIPILYIIITQDKGKVPIGNDPSNSVNIIESNTEEFFLEEFTFEEYPIKFTYNSDWVVKSNSPENVTLQKDDYVFTLNTEQRGIGFEEPEPIVTESFIQKNGKDIIINGNSIKRLNVYYPDTNEYSYLINIHYSDSAIRMYSVLINYSSKENTEVPQQMLKELDSIVASLEIG